MGSERVLKKVVVILLHALIGWGICGAIIGIGRSVTSKETTLIVHLIAVPIVFAALSFTYHRYFRYTPPVATAFIFMGSAMALDAGIVAPVFEKSFDMFTAPLSVIGTWIPFACIFLSTFFIGTIVTTRRAAAGAPAAGAAGR